MKFKIQILIKSNIFFVTIFECKIVTLSPMNRVIVGEETTTTSLTDFRYKDVVYAINTWAYEQNKTCPILRYLT